jgi:flagellar hook-associated protein 3 FlgL
MRVGDIALFRFFRDGITSKRSQIADSVKSLSDGKRVRHASDDPSGARTSLLLRGRLARIEGYQRATRASRFDLVTIDQNLGQIIGLVTEARTHAMAGVTGVLSEGNDERADTIDALRHEILSLANVYQNGRYLFGGTETLTAPFDPAGAYQGNGDEARAPLDQGEDVGVTVDGGTTLQGAGDLFLLLEDLAAALRAGDTAAVQALIPDFSVQLDQLTGVRNDIGNRISRIDSFDQRHGDEKLRLMTRISEIEDASLEQIATELAAADASVQALSSTASRVLGRSLFDYLG